MFYDKDFDEAAAEVILAAEMILASLIEEESYA